MKITAFLLTVVCFGATANTNAQRITLQEKRISLEKALLAIKQQSGYNLFYKVETVQQYGKAVDVNIKNATVAEALAQVFQKQHLTYEIAGSTIIVKEKQEKKEVAGVVNTFPIQQAAVLVLPLDVKGVVRDESGKPAVGVSVIIKGTQRGTTTNEAGEFSLTGVSDNAILVFSSVNLQTFEVKVQAGNANSITVTLKAKISELGDIAVTTVSTGIQDIPKERSTGSFGFINNQIVERTVSTDIASRIRGTTAGLLVSNSSSARTGISVRTASTILANKQALIIVDNFPFDGDLNNINPNDVETVTILKDAAAASIWGVLAGNGVVVITTKKGRYNQKAKVTFNSNFRITDRPDLFYTNSQLSGKDYVDLETYLFGRGFYNSNITSTTRPRLTPAVEILLNRRNGTITASDSANRLDLLRQYDVRNDLSKYYYRPSAGQQYALNVSGGSANQQYFASIGYDKNLDAIVGSDYQRVTINGNNTYSFLKGSLELNTSLWYTQTISNAGGSIAATYPYARLADEDGNALSISRYRTGYTDTIGGGKLLSWMYYPLDDFKHSTTNVKGISIRIGSELKYRVSQSFNVSLKYLYEKGSTETRNLNDVQSFFARDLINTFSSINYSTGVVTNRIPIGGILDIANSNYVSKGLRGQVNYSNKWKNLHSINGLVGAELRDLNTNGYNFRSYGYNSNNLTSAPVDLISLFPTIITGGTRAIPSNYGFYDKTQRVVSLFSNVAYTYDNKYTISASARKDGSNQFGVSANNKWKPLWSAGLGWDIAKENFYRISWLPTLRLRGTYGFQGNIDYSTAALLTIRQTSNNFYNIPYALITNTPNPNLGWEQVRTINFGLDFGFLSNRLTGSIDYFIKKGVDLIGVNPLPESAGVSSFKTNGANISGKGLEVTINYRNRWRQIEWLSSLNFSYAKDWVTDYKITQSNARAYVVAGGIGSGGFAPIVGNPVSAVYSFKWAGLDPTTGDPQGIFNKQVSKSYSSIINSTDLSEMVYSGSAAPKYFGNFLNTITYANLSLSFNLIYKMDFVFRKPSVNYGELFTASTFHNDYTRRWQKSGDEQTTNVPSLVYPANANRDLFYNYSEILISKGDYIRLQDIRLNYQIGSLQNATQQFFTAANIYCTVSNIGYIWKATDKKTDPENPSGLQRIAPTFAAGVKLEF